LGASESSRSTIDLDGVMTQDSLESRRVKVVTLKVRYSSATVDEFIDKHALDVSQSGIYIMTANPFPPGTLIKFEILLANGRPVITGAGRVAWKRDGAQASGVRPAGMGVKFIEIDELSTALIDKLVAARPDAGLVYEEEEETSSSAAGEAPSETRSPLFPKSDAEAKAPPTDEPTLMKHVSELLEEALHETGGSMEELANPLFSGIAHKQDALAATPSPTKSAVEELRVPPPLPPLPRVKAWPVTASPPSVPVALARPALDRRKKWRWGVLLASGAVATLALTLVVHGLLRRNTPTTPSVETVKTGTTSVAAALSVAPEIASSSAAPAPSTPVESTPVASAAPIASASVPESVSPGPTTGVTTGSTGSRKPRPTAKGAAVSPSTPKPPWKTGLKYVDDNPY
jgi:uncharacterized protein (TIGR02266 family)